MLPPPAVCHPGSSIVACFVSLRNNTSIPAQFEFIFPTTKDVDAEDWAEEAPLTPEQEHINDLMDAKVFAIEPRKAKLGVCVGGRCADCCRGCTAPPLLAPEVGVAGLSRATVTFTLVVERV